MTFSFHFKTLSKHFGLIQKHKFSSYKLLGAPLTVDRGVIDSQSVNLPIKASEYAGNRPLLWRIQKGDISKLKFLSGFDKLRNDDYKIPRHGEKEKTTKICAVNALKILFSCNGFEVSCAYQRMWVFWISEHWIWRLDRKYLVTIRGDITSGTADLLWFSIYRATVALDPDFRPPWPGDCVYFPLDLC